MENGSGKICPMIIGLSLGLLWGVSLLILGLIAHWCSSYGREFITMIGSIYPGYTQSISGSFIGLAWGFVDLFCAGFIFALLYNCLSKCKSKCKGCGHAKSD
jgi:hypothetical protein